MFKTRDGIIRVISTTAAVTALTIGGIAVAPMLSGCSAISQLDKKGIAATFDGGEITEDEVNSYIADYRKAHGLEEKSAWHGYLKQSGTTASSMRRTAIDTLEERKVIENEAGKRGIDVKKSDIDGKIKELSDYYGYDRDGWRKQLKTLGYTENGYRAYIKDSLLRERLMQKVIKVSDAKDSDVISLANDYTGSIDGAKRLSVITFDDSSKAGICADSIASGETTFEKAKKENGGDSNYDGWDCIVSEDETVSSAVKDMKQGDVSGAIAGEKLSFIVKVEEEVSVPKGGFTDKSQMPEGLYDDFKSSVELNNRYTQFNDYVNDLMSKAELKINDMPKDVPYSD